MAKKWPNFGLKNGQNFDISEFSWHVEYDFLKEDHKKNFHTKIRKIHSGVWKLLVKNSQNCQFWPKNGQILVLNGKNFAISDIYRMIFLKKVIIITSIPKIRKIHSGVWKFKAENPQNCQFWPKMAKFWHKWPNFGHLRIFPAYTL